MRIRTIISKRSNLELVSNFADSSVLHLSNIWENKRKPVNVYSSLNSTIEQYHSLYKLIHIFIDISILRLSIKKSLAYWSFSMEILVFLSLKNILVKYYIESRVNLE